MAWLGRLFAIQEIAGTKQSRFLRVMVIMFEILIGKFTAGAKL